MAESVVDPVVDADAPVGRTSPSVLREWMVRFRTLAILGLILPLFAVHRLALWMDGIFFRSLGETPVVRPLFLVGLPRSGTTLMHRLVASQASCFTTMPLWELLFAPALCEKYFWRWVYRADRAVGRPAGRLLAAWQRRFTQSIDEVHPTTLFSPEEDYLGLLPFDGCFLRVLVWPHAPWTWRLGRFSEELSEAEKKRLLEAYRGLIVRHLVFRGPHRAFLSKNPSFTAWLPALVEEFPDARFIGLRRNPLEAVPSQLSSLQSGLAVFGHSAFDERIVQRFVELLSEYWRRLQQAESDWGPWRFQIVEYESLTADPQNVVENCVQQLGYSPRNVQESEWLAELCQAARRYSSRHRYALTDFGWTALQLQPWFPDELHPIAVNEGVRDTPAGQRAASNSRSPTPSSAERPASESFLPEGEPNHACHRSSD